MAKSNGQYADSREDAASKRRASKPAGTVEKPFRWCNVSITEAMKEDIRRMEFDPVRVFEWLEGMISEGYKVTFSYDEKSDCNMVIVVGRREGALDYNVGVSSRHNHLSVALLTTFYKFDVLFMGGSIPSESLDARTDTWD